MKLERLYKTNTHDAFAHLLAVGICTGVLFLFVGLTYSRIILPRYTTKYSEKDVQQVINLIVTIVATVIGILFSHCRRLTNEAETKTELRDEQLTIPRLHVHFEAASGSKVAMGIPVIRNRQVWRLVAFYFLAMIIFAFVHSVLSVIFVIEAVISDKGEPVPVHIPLSIDIIKTGHDPCATNIDSPGCTYVIALQALSSQLVSYQPYIIGGVTFEPPNGTMGLPYHAMKHFAEQVSRIPFESARRRYCLPVLDPHVIKCTEVPIDPDTCESVDNFVKFKSMNVSYWKEDLDGDGPGNKFLGTGTYKITSPFPRPYDDYGSTVFRTDDQGRGVMVLQKFSGDDSTSLIAAANAYGEFGYASMLHRLMYDGRNPDYSDEPKGATYDFAARCNITAIADKDNLASSWRQVDFTLNSGVLRANVTDEQCPNPRAISGRDASGFYDLMWSLNGAGAIISSSDGYSKFFNEHPAVGAGTNVFSNMSRLDAVVNQIYHIVQTAWTESASTLAMDVPAVQESPITMLEYPHLFVIQISWTPTTWIGLVLSFLIALNSWVLAARWIRATYRRGGAHTWNLLRPVDLMAYSLAASRDLLPALNTGEHRKMEMRGENRTFLREHSDDLVSLINGTSEKRFGSESSASSPVRDYDEKVEETLGSSVSVRERNVDLENGK